MKEKRLKLILEKHSPNAKAQPVLLLNQKIHECLKSIAKARRSKGTAVEKEKRIRTAMEDLYDDLQYVTEPAILCPMETCILLNQIRWSIFDLGINLRVFKLQENQDFYFDFDNSLDKLFARIPEAHQTRAKKINQHLRILKFLSCLESEIAYQENVQNGLKFKWTVLALALCCTVFIAIGLESFQVLVPGIAISIAAYIMTSFLTNTAHNTDDIPGGFNQRYRYLSKRSRRSIKENCIQTLEAVVRENKWRYPTTLAQTQKLKPRCLHQIMVLADPSTQVANSERSHLQLTLSQ